MITAAGTTSTDALVSRLWTAPDEVAKAYFAALKEGRRADAADLAVAVGHALMHTGASETALTLLGTYLKAWGRGRDERTAEALVLAANAAEDTGDRATAERHLARVIRITADGRWPIARRQALQSLGVLRNRQGRPADRDALYAEALSLAKRSGDRHGEASLLNNLGAVALEDGRSAEGRRLLETSIALRRELGREDDAAGTLAMLGGDLAGAGEFDAGRTALKLAVRLARRSGDRRVLATAFLNLGTLSADAGRPAQALPWTRRGLEQATALKDLGLQKLCHQGLAVSYFRLGRAADAARHFGELLKLCERLGDAWDAAMAHHDLGSVSVVRGDRAAGVREYGVAAERFRALGDHEWHARCVVSVAANSDRHAAGPLLTDLLAVPAVVRSPGFPASDVTDEAVKTGDDRLVRRAMSVERRRFRGTASEWAWRVASAGAAAGESHHWPVAERLYSQALRLYGDNRPPGVMENIENDLGVALLEQGEVAKARTLFVKLLAHARRRRNRVVIAQVAHNLAAISRRDGEQARAVAYLREAVAAADETGDVEAAVGSLHSLGLAYADQEKIGDADRAFRRSRKLAEQLKDGFHLAQAEMGAGLVAFHKGEFRGSLARYRAALHLFERSGAKFEQAKAVHNMGLATERLGRLQPATDLYLRAAEMAGDAYDWPMAATGFQSAARLTAEHGTLGETARLLAAALMASLASPDPGEAFRSALQAYLVARDAVNARRQGRGDKLRDAIVRRVEADSERWVTDAVRRSLAKVTWAAPG
ncbi:MAG: hypothetical protein JWO31_2607 [Phycisphaerales bacterium]|nr:hypothetical protein [Phycisphaerales bacterium]